MICRRHVPMAELLGVLLARNRKCPIGLTRGTLEVPSDFFESLPGDAVDGLEAR